MKKLSAILLLLTLTAPFTGTYLFFQYNKNNIRREVAEKIFAGLDEKDIILLKFTKKETETRLNWKHSREFEFEGQMYDIIEKKQEGGIIWYYCYKDHKETKLNKLITVTTGRALGQDPARKSQSEKVVSFMKSFFRQDAFAWKPSFLQPAKIQFSFINFHFSFYLPSPPTPPPELA